MNSNRKVKKQQSQNYASSNQNTGIYNFWIVFLLIFWIAQSDQTDLSCQDDDPYANTRIPCEWCGQAVPLEHFENHAVS